MQQILTVSLEQALDRSPLVVSPHTPLADVIDLMSQASSRHQTRIQETVASDLEPMTERQTSCALVLDHSRLVGILTERDIVRLIADYRSLADLTVADVMTREVFTLQLADDLDVFAVLDRMRRHQIRHLPVVDQQGEVLGLLTPRSLRNLLQPADVMRFRKVHEVMNLNVIHAVPTCSVHQITQMMVQHRVSCVVIIESEGSSDSLRPVGIVTERDIVQFQRLGLNLVQTQAEEVMSTPLSLVRPEDSLWTVHQMMQHHRVRRLVVANEQDMLQGIVTQSNLLPMDPAEMYEMLNLLQQQVCQLEIQNRDLLQQRNQELEQVVEERTAKLQRREQILKSLALEVSADTGEDFLRSQLPQLTEALQVDYAHIGRLCDDGSIQTLAAFGNGQIQPNFEYALAGTPCEDVITQKACIHHQGVQALFPDDPMLRDDQIEGYFGTPLLNTAGQVMGLIVALSRQPQSDLDLIEEGLTAFAIWTSAELERQEAESERQRFFTLSLDLLCVAGLDGYFKQINPAFERILGYSDAELMAEPFLDFVHPDDRAATLQEMEQLGSGVDTIAFENRYRCQDGSYRWFLWNTTPDLEQKLLYATARDITDRKQMEQSLVQKAKQQATVAKLGQLALASKDLDQLMDEVVVEIASTLDVEYCKVLKLLPDGESMLLKAGVGWQAGLVGQAVIGTDADSQAGYTLRSDHPVIVANLQTETRFSGPPLLIKHNVISGMSVIVQGQHKIYGVIGAHTVKHRLFSQNDIDFLQSVANLLSQTLERVQADQIVRQSEANYRTLTENLPGIVYRVFPEEQHGMVFLNNQCQTLTGYSTEELSSGEVCSIDPLIVPEDRPHVIATVKKAVAHQMPFLVEYRIKDRADNIRYFWEKGQPIPARESQPPYIDGVIFDVTERKQAELAQLESQERLNSILSSLQDAIWSIASDTSEVLYLSPAAETIYDRPRTEFYETSKLWEQVVHPEDRDRFKDSDQVLRETGSAECEYRIVRPDGTVRWLRERAKVIYDADGGPIRMDGVVTDITDRKQAQLQVREQAALLDVATDAILVRSMDDEIKFWNQGATKIYGWTEEEALGQNANQLLYSETVDGEELIQADLQRLGSWQGERKQVTKVGQEITVMSRWTLVQDDQENPRFILTVNTDITTQKQLEAQFLRAQRLESIGTLASGIAHDLNNILTPIYGVAQLLPLLLPNASEQIQHQFEIIQKSSKRGTDIIEQVLSFSRGAEGDRTALNVKHLISEIRTFVHRTFPKSLEMSVNIADELWSVKGDATQLYQVLMNLFVNARDAMPEGGTLTVTAQNLNMDQALATGHIEAQVGAYIKVTVADTGIGIPIEQQEHIFEPFFSTKQATGGTGLGLSTVYSIIQSHGGFITVDSKVNKGTLFSVYLPAIEAEEGIEAEATNLPSGKGELILVVDDEAPIRDVTRSVLEQYNYRALVAADGVDAIAQYAEHKTEINVVLMDMNMPALDGATTIRTMQKINPQLRVIIVSGSPIDEQITVSIGESIKGLLQKPYSAEALLQTLQGVLEAK
ncbi:Sensor kinase CckA [Acaryochloris thomasi RCC1774]|uniref:histidine kinase n=1 Tax=Acaryochloris thomasi RCC1774 TaxID=1764569 RepID=A0A2W1JAM1_9CYAN|nr:PAS domain S-box protein [Acaryochloris thomasi]PZD71173.1 Sensor kinase CckA [Acaryochloris thomasi RCC1774]